MYFYPFKLIFLSDVHRSTFASLFFYKGSKFCHLLPYFFLKTNIPSRKIGFGNKTLTF